MTPGRVEDQRMREFARAVWRFLDRLLRSRVVIFSMLLGGALVIVLGATGKVREWGGVTSLTMAGFVVALFTTSALQTVFGQRRSLTLAGALVFAVAMAVLGTALVVSAVLGYIHPVARAAIDALLGAVLGSYGFRWLFLGLRLIVRGDRST